MVRELLNAIVLCVVLGTLFGCANIATVFNAFVGSLVCCLVCLTSLVAALASRGDRFMMGAIELLVMVVVHVVYFEGCCMS